MFDLISYTGSVWYLTRNETNDMLIENIKNNFLTRANFSFTDEFDALKYVNKSNSCIVVSFVNKIAYIKNVDFSFNKEWEIIDNAQKMIGMVTRKINRIYIEEKGDFLEFIEIDDNNEFHPNLVDICKYKFDKNDGKKELTSRINFDRKFLPSFISNLVLLFEKGYTKEDPNLLEY